MPRGPLSRRIEIAGEISDKLRRNVKRIKNVA
jgi:hypothetical protein